MRRSKIIMELDEKIQKAVMEFGLPITAEDIIGWVEELGMQPPVRSELLGHEAYRSACRWDEDET